VGYNIFSLYCFILPLEARWGEVNTPVMLYLPAMKNLGGSYGNTGRTAKKNPEA
jgi:hypothetical protein